MNARDQDIHRFVADAGLSDGCLSPVSGDASDRRYFRVSRTDGSNAILMDAPPEKCGSQSSFLAVDGYLRELGLSAPEIFATDLEAGLILMEDLGSALYSSQAEVSCEHETVVYTAAIDVFNALRTPPMPGLKLAGAETLSHMILPAFDAYASLAGVSAGRSEKQTLINGFHEILETVLADEPFVSALRDFHAGNLIWLPDRAGAARVGLLDFQDAIATHPAYDLVSLLQDARRDLAPGLEDRLVDLYVGQNDLDPDRFQAAYRAIGAQRHLRILGVFAHLAAAKRKTGYLRYMARTWAHLMKDLGHPCLAPWSEKLLVVLPEPTPAVLARLGANE